MKRRPKIGLGAAFCAGMLSLSACNTEQPLYGVPDAVEIDDPAYSAVDESEEIQAVYGPPALDDAPALSRGDVP